MNRQVARLRVMLLAAAASGWWWCVPSRGCAAPPQEPPNLPAASDRPVDFAADVQPLLKKHCLSCHGPQRQESNYRLDVREIAFRGGDFEQPPIIPRKSAESPLIHYVAHAPGADTVMPPKDKGKLTAEQIGVLRGWIDQGAVWPDALAGEATLASDHWSLQPVRPLSPPPSPSELAAWVRTPVDAFVAVKLAEAELGPSPAADRRTLIRRLYLDVWGIPPAPEDVQAFVDDSHPLAYARLVDRVLADPHYGERWARHWLDVVRFAESHGFETNRERPHAYHYRDYVIRSLNVDKPYDQFVSEQLAGDRLGADAATGFLVAGAYDIVKSPDKLLTLTQRQDELADMIHTTGAAFLGLTLGCARCHNHKFDPITQRDYYSLQAVFAGVKHGERPLTQWLTPDAQTRWREVQQRLAQVRPLLAGKLPPPPRTQGAQLIDDAAPWLPAKLPGESPEESRGESPAESPAARRLPTLATGCEHLVPPTGTGDNRPGDQRGAARDPGVPGSRWPNLSGGSYSWWKTQPGQTVAVYHLGGRGACQLWLSWGCGFETHARDVRYVLDRDGDLSTREDQQLVATIDQQQFADASAASPLVAPCWSGLRWAGVWQLAPESVLLLQSGPAGGVVTADVVAVQPLPTGQEDQHARRREKGPLAEQPLVLRSPPAARGNIERFAPRVARRVRMEITRTTGAEVCLDEIEVFAAPAASSGSGPAGPAGPAELSPEQNVALASRGATVAASGVYMDGALPIHQRAHLNDGKYGNSHSWIAKHSGPAWVELTLDPPRAIHAIAWARDREGKYADRLATEYRFLVQDAAGSWHVVADSGDRVPPHTPQPAGWQLAGQPAERLAEVLPLLRETAALEREAERLQPQQQQVVYAGTFETPPPVHRLYRGDPLAPREQVVPDALQVLGSLGLNNDAPEAERRLALARWIASPENPLTARVIVNRIWQHHFGRGLVATPNDFGANGSPPSHPDLLDWLAGELVRGDWSLKRIHRMILLSNTYRQSSVLRPEAVRRDAQARLLWRFPSRRLEAEAIRDSILSVSGALNTARGGPGFGAFEVVMENVRHYFPREDWGPPQWRRMIYMTKVRQEQDALFGSFDCPDGSQIIARRSRSTTPLQALNLLNSPFLLQQAELLAGRLTREAGETPPAAGAREPLTRLFQLAYGRPPTPGERAACEQLAAQHGLAAVCRAVLNTNEFLFLP